MFIFPSVILSNLSLKDMLSNLGEITGEEASEEIINEIFSRFCLGKWSNQKALKSKIKGFYR